MGLFHFQGASITSVLQTRKRHPEVLALSCSSTADESEELGLKPCPPVSTRAFPLTLLSEVLVQQAAEGREGQKTFL